jgi:hypothetical protein
MRTGGASCVRWPYSFPSLAVQSSSLCCLFLGIVMFAVALPLHAQDLALYDSLIAEAESLYSQQRYHESGRTYGEAFTALDGAGRLVDRFNAACSWSLAGAADEAFHQLYHLAGHPSFTRDDWLTADADLRPLHGDPRWEEVVASVRRNAGRAEASRTHEGSFHYTRMMLLFNANPAALNARLPEGWVVRSEGSNIVIGFCDVWASHDNTGRLIAGSQVKYIPINGSAWNMATGESTNIRYTEYADHPERLIAAGRDDIATGDVVPSRITRESRITHSDSSSDIYHERWRIEPDGGGVIELRATFTHRVSWSTATSAMDVVYASNPGRRLHLRNEEMHNIISGPGRDSHLLDFELTIDLPGWEDVFDGTEELLSVRFIPTAKRDVFVYDRR